MATPKGTTSCSYDDQQSVTETLKGVLSSSPGLPYSATLGDGAASVNPEGVAACGSSYIRPPDLVVEYRGPESRNPVGVGTHANRRPRVAEYGNPGL